MTSHERKKISPQEVLKIMLKNDRFSHWMGLDIDDHGKGYCRLHCRIREDMLNGFGTVHGGILFSAADSAFAFACNSHGHITVALDVSITFALPVKAGEVLSVEAREIHRGRRTGIYEVKVVNEQEKLVALFKGTAYQTAETFADIS